MKKAAALRTDSIPQGSSGSLRKGSAPEGIAYAARTGAWRDAQESTSRRRRISNGGFGGTTKATSDGLWMRTVRLT